MAIADRTVAVARPDAAPSSVGSAPVRLSRARSIDDVRRLAQRRLPRAVFDFFDGGAETESTMQENRAAFERLRLLPRTLVDVSRVDLTTTVLDAPASMPMVIAPTGAAGFGWPGGDVAVARAATSFGIPYVLSTTATASIERIAREAPGRLWFQAYILRERANTMKLIERARMADYDALVITVDLPVGGKRERDFRNDFSIPFRFTPRNLLDFASKPGWALSVLRNGIPVMENITGLVPAAAGAVAVASSVGRNYDPAFDWDGLKAIRDAWPRKLVIKGVVHPDDATKAAALGCDAIVVSNHGGRQLDGGIATADALPAIAAAVGTKMEVMVDGGIRRGASIVKALALGARAVMIGRPTLYGVAAAGEPGARCALDILLDEFKRTMQLCGVRDVGSIGPDLLVRSAASAD